MGKELQEIMEHIYRRAYTDSERTEIVKKIEAEWGSVEALDSAMSKGAN
jgi:hypothetical protein